MYDIFAQIWLILTLNVGEYTSPMDPMSRDGSAIHGLIFQGFQCYVCVTRDILPAGCLVAMDSYGSVG